MSIEIAVLFQGTLPTKAALTRAMKELGFPLTISPPTGSLEKQSGYMPMRFRREETGVQFDLFNGRTAIENLTKDLVGGFDPRFDRSANFRWGGDEDEMICGMCAAAALAKLVNGVVLDVGGETLSADEATAWATQHLRDAAPPAKRGGGTRPADIKHYLKPLLNLRSDLVLVDRLLVIRPVRHIVRGVMLDRTGRKYRFRIHRFLQPLASGIAYGTHLFGLRRWDVWQPYFEPALMDVLAEDVFESIGRRTTLAEVARDGGGWHHTVAMLLLAGERDRAEEYIREVESRELMPYQLPIVAAVRERLGQDIDELCADARACEAITAKALKIEHIWEPSPFPVELPAAERRARSDEVLFIPRPWVARPSWLLQELPESVGEIRYAKDFLVRKGRSVLVASLARDDAEDRHRNSEPYVLAARLSEGPALVLFRDGEDRNDPSRRPGYIARGDLILWLHGSTVTAGVSLSQADDNKGMLELVSIDIHESLSKTSVWSWERNREASSERIRDDRGEGSFEKKQRLTDAEAKQLVCPKPAFGEFDTLASMIMMVLRTRGYGELA
jgi:hypothetical protein